MVNMSANALDELKSKIQHREAVVTVIGLGYVGLPLAVLFAESGFHVIGIDLDRSKIDAINGGHSYIQDIPSDRIAKITSPSRKTLSDPEAEKKFWATDDYAVLDETDAVIVCVPTPLSKTKDPDISYIISATDQIAKHLHNGMLISLESTTYPGTTEEVILPTLQKAASKRIGGEHLQVGEDFFLVFSPERTDPSRQDWTVKNTPKVVGGVTVACTDAALSLYGSAVDKVVPVSSPTVAEMVKLLENTFRATNIGLVNEIAIMCDKLGIDVWDVIEAAKTKPFGFMHFYPGPGLGGHCIPVDPRYLAWKLKTLNYTARFIQLAEEINFGMPEYVLGKVADALNEVSKPLKGSHLLVLGVAYKADVSDIRESPALDLIHLLKGKGAEVVYHDPHVPSLNVEDLKMESVPLDFGTLKDSDCVVIATDHTVFDWQWIVDNSSVVVDTRNATKGVSSEGAYIVKL